MVGLLSGMDNEDRSSVGPSEMNVSVTQEDSNAPKAAADESQPAPENTDNVDEVEHVKELKSILKQRGQYTFRKVKVDFDLIPKKIPYDENDYTVEIKIVEKEPVKIKSWAAIFAARKAEAEAEAAALAEAEEALKKAEEVQKREALKKANKAKLSKPGEQSELKQTNNLPSDQHLEANNGNDNTDLAEQTTTAESSEHPQPEPSQQFTNQNLLTEENDNEDPLKESNALDEIDTTGASTSTEVTPEPTVPNLPPEDYKLAESIVDDVLSAVISPDVSLTEEVNLERLEAEPKDEEGSSCTESLAAERSEHLEEEHTNDGEEISAHDDPSVSLFLEDSNAGESLSQDTSTSQSQASHTKSDLEDKSTADTSETGSDITQVTETTTHSEDDSSKLVDLRGKKVPKKVLVTAASLVEEILAETPKVMQIVPKNEENMQDPTLNEIETKPTDETPLRNSKLAENKDRNSIAETGAQRKRREFKKSSNSKILEHVKRSLESAAPEILETAVGVLEEIEKIVVEKVGPAIP